MEVENFEGAKIVLFSLGEQVKAGFGFHLVGVQAMKTPRACIARCKTLSLKKSRFVMTGTSAILAIDVPTRLVYEWDDGSPIYYRNYQEVLSGKITSEEVMADSTLQAWIKSKLYLFLCGALLEKGYEILVGEIGMQLAPKSTRAADIAIFKAETFTLSNKYTEQAPEIVIEIDVKADYANSGKLIEYYELKTQKLLAFGVKKVIWIFTDSETVIVINPDQKLFLDWSDEVEVLPGFGLRLDDLLKR